MADEFIDPYENYFTEEKYEILKKELDKINKKKLENNIDEEDLKLFDNIYDKIIYGIIDDKKLNTPNNIQLLLKFSKLYIDYLELKDTILNKQKAIGSKRELQYARELRRKEITKVKAEGIIQQAEREIKEARQKEERDVDIEQSHLEILRKAQEALKAREKKKTEEEEKKKKKKIKKKFKKKLYKKKKKK